MTTSCQHLLVVGAQPHCGKTVIITGLAMALSDAGFRMQAYKPLAFVSESPAAAPIDQAFMNHLTQQYLQAETLQLPNAWETSNVHWLRLTETCQTLTYPSLLEAPGLVATPWQRQQQRLKDASDFAHELNAAVLLVSRTDDNAFEHLHTALQFLKAKNTLVMGLIQTQVHAMAPSAEDLAPDMMWLSREFTVPFLGSLPYSPSIHVQTVQQGNLLRLTQDNIDLLPLQMSLQLAVSGRP